MGTFELIKETFESNKYENALRTNPEQARQINEDITELVEKATPVLKQVQLNPRKENEHLPQTGKNWASHYLSDRVNEIMDSYGVVCSTSFNQLKGVPSETKKFLKDAVKYRTTTIYG